MSHRYPYRMFPLEPLVTIVETRWRPRSNYISHISFNGKAAQVLATDRKSVYRWARTGLRRNSAERVAHHLGMHPASIWPNWWTS